MKPAKRLVLTRGAVSHSSLSYRACRSLSSLSRLDCLRLSALARDEPAFLFDLCFCTNEVALLCSCIPCGKLAYRIRVGDEGTKG